MAGMARPTLLLNEFGDEIEVVCVAGALGGMIAYRFEDYLERVAPEFVGDIRAYVTNIFQGRH